MYYSTHNVFTEFSITIINLIFMYFFVLLI